MSWDPDERARRDGAPADDEFEAIVAGWRREGRVPSWPDDPRAPAALFEPGPVEPAPLASDAPEDEHFVPPEPPPLPPIGPPVAIGMALIAAGLLLVVGPGWLGVAESYGLPLGLVAIAAGLGWLVLRLWPDPPDTGDPHRDDGAVL